MSSVIDKAGYRANVAIIILNEQGKVFWGKRVGQESWQFPQGGVDNNETPLVAMYRELYEEVGLKPQDVELFGCTAQWLKYNLPKKMHRTRGVLCVGQKQKWFLLKLKSPESAFNFNCGLKAEFDDWRWVNYWYPVKHVIYFKQNVYRKALRYFVGFQRQFQNNSSESNLNFNSSSNPNPQHKKPKTGLFGRKRSGLKKKPAKGRRGFLSKFK